MANLQLNSHIITISRRQIHRETKSLTPYTSLTTLLKQRSLANDKLTRVKSLSERNSNSNSGNALVQQRAPDLDDVESEIIIEQTGEMECLVKGYGWKVRRMVESKGEMKMVALVQAHAFHVPSMFFDDFVFHYFQAEILADLYYRLRNSPPDRYACLVAEHAKEDNASPISVPHQLVGAVDIIVSRDDDVLRHLEGAQEYLYVEGIAVSENYRRQKVATVLLEACQVIAVLWGHQYLVLRAYEDDSGARALYTNAGYRLVARDPIWVTWFGRKRRILMVKRLW